MSVQLSSLRVSMEGDSSSYVTAANAVDVANRQMAESGTLAGAQLAQQDIAAGNAGAALTRLSKANVDGYRIRCDTMRHATSRADLAARYDADTRTEAERWLNDPPRWRSALRKV